MQRIKRTLAFLLFLTTLLFCGCGEREGKEKTPSGEGTATADTLLEAICISQTDLPSAVTVLREDAPPESRGYFGVDHGALLYLGDKNTPFPLFSRLASARVRLADTLSGCEIHILEAHYPEDIPLLENLLRDRLHILQKRDIRLFLGEAYEKNVAAGQVLVKDRFVLLLTVPDPAAAIQAVERIM